MGSTEERNKKVRKILDELYEKALLWAAVSSYLAEERTCPTKLTHPSQPVRYPYSRPIIAPI